MKILLINPWMPEVFPPPSIGYIQSALKQWQINVIACDYNRVSEMKDEYDIVGVSFHSFSVKYAMQMRMRFSSHLICGGHHPSALPEQMLELGYDQVIVGEGENAIIDIIQGNSNKIIRAEDVEHKYFFDINAIPVPDYSGLFFGGEMGIPVISSRGCPYSCNFCASSDFWKHKYKFRSPENIILELNRRIKEGYTTWMFEDDNFTMNRQRALEICRMIDGTHVWQCASRAESLDVELCRELYRAGCRTVWLGIESLSQDSLNRCNKHTTVEKMVEGIKNAHKSKISTVCQLIVGLPGDSIHNIKETRENLRKYKIQASSNIAWILPKTKIHEEALKRGFSDKEYYVSGAPYYTYEQDINTLRTWANLINGA